MNLIKSSKVDLSWWFFLAAIVIGLVVCLFMIAIMTVASWNLLINNF